MATYEYICLSCEHRFEERRPMGSSVRTEVACPNCGSDRARRRFSFAAATGTASETGLSPEPLSSSGGCGCGHCTCGN